MMRKRSLYLFILSSLIPCCLFSQHLVRDACAEQRRLCDSTLQAIYGSEVYSYFHFDTNSQSRTVDRKWVAWNDSLRGDSITYCRFEYSFVFPGAKPQQFIHAPIINDTGIYLPPSIRNVPKCEKIIDSTKLDSITRKLLKKPLRECEVCIYDENAVGTDRNPIFLDTTHIYFMVTYSEVSVKDKDKYTTEITKHHFFVVDGVTGFVPEKPGKTKTGRTRSKQ